jgi:hypothetical protein
LTESLHPIASPGARLVTIATHQVENMVTRFKPSRIPTSPL